MPTNTANFGLIKPGKEEFYNVDVPNSNMDTIDGLLKALQDAINSGASEQDLKDLRNALATHLAEKATTTGYGHTILNSTVTSTSHNEAATAGAVKAAVDLANTKAPLIHTHTIGQVTGLQTGLDSKVNESLRNVPNGFVGLDASGNLPPGIVQGQFKKVLEINVGGQATFSFPNLSSYEEFEITISDLKGNRPSASGANFLITANDNVPSLGIFSGSRMSNGSIGSFMGSGSSSTSTLNTFTFPGAGGEAVYINTRLNFKKIGYKTWLVSGASTVLRDYFNQNSLTETVHVLGSFGGVTAQLDKLAFRINDNLPMNSGKAELWVKI